MRQARYNRRNESPSRYKGGLGARDSHFRYFDSRCNGGGPPVEVVTDHLDPAHHVLEIAGNRDFLHRVREFAVLDPDSAGSARVVAGDHVHPESDRLGQVESLLHRADYLLRRVTARFEIEIGGRYGWRVTDRARRVAGRRESELARRIAIEQVRREHAFVDDVSAR